MFPELTLPWYAHDLVPKDIPPDEDEVLYARRLVAQRCLYGVDKNDMAVDLAKLSLWLVTLAKDHPFTFLDHSLRHGDSLVGLTRRQIIGFHWEPKKQKSLGEDLIQKRLDRATEARAEILNACEDVAYFDQAQRLAVADEALNVVRLTGDACVSAFFSGKKKKEREERREALFGSVSDWYSSGMVSSKRAPIREAAASLRKGEHPIPPFHLEIEFPEVVLRENGGFDGFVGNPPFLGGRRTSMTYGAVYSDWLSTTFDEASNNSDLVAFFYRKGHDALRRGGTLGLIATNTIAQGDTRHTGLRWICNSSGTIYSVRSRVRWPGQAAVVVSVVHIMKAEMKGPFLLDGRLVEHISAFLFHAGGNENPRRLAANIDRSFQGMIVLGMGFTFDDDAQSEDANSIAEMHELILKDPGNAERIFPYIGGEEILNSPTQAHRRYVIDFGDMSLEQASQWPDLLNVLETKVKAGRQKQKRKPLREKWWQYADKRPALRQALRQIDRVLVHPFVTNKLAFSFLSPKTIVAGPTYVFTLDRYSHFCVLQSRVHDFWARFFSSSFKDDLRYTPSDCFDTFPFPKDDATAPLEDIGREYYEYRSHYMANSGEGLTKTNNRFHNRHENSGEIMQLRELHDVMDRTVLAAYGWDDLARSTRCEFLLDYDEEEDDENDSGKKKSKKKKPWRLRWPDEFRDEVLARLLELNEQRAKEEALTGRTGSNAPKANNRSNSKKSSRNASATDQRDLFEKEVK